MIRALELSVPASQALAFSDARLRITWDDRAAAFDRCARRALLRRRHALQPRRPRVSGQGVPQRHPVSTSDRVHLRCYFPMPFFRSREDRAGRAPAPIPPTSAVARAARAVHRSAQPRRLLPRHLSRSSGSPSPARTWCCSTPRRREGGGDWSGSFVGTSFIFSHDAVLTTLEGDPRFFFDDSQTPAGATAPAPRSGAAAATTGAGGT